MHLNYIYGQNVEVFIDSLKKTGQVNEREIITYRSHLSKTTKSFPRYVKPTIYKLEGVLYSEELSSRRKMEYLNTIDNTALLVLGSEHDAMYGYISNVSFSRLSVDAVNVSFSFISAARAISDMVSEAEDAMYYGDPVEVDDSDASGGKSIELDAQNDMVYFVETQSSYRLPLGDYKVFVRAKDTAQVADDLQIRMYNDSDSTNIGSTTKTLAADYTLYESDTFTVASGDEGDTIGIIAEKATTTANTISIDFIGFARV
jgi:hypothetical protein